MFETSFDVGNFSKEMKEELEQKMNAAIASMKCSEHREGAKITIEVEEIKHGSNPFSVETCCETFAYEVLQKLSKV